MFPPKETASVYVTKSPTLDPLPESVTVIVEDPSVAAKVAAPAALVRLMGVTSLYEEPSWMYSLYRVPNPRSFVPSRSTQACSFLPVPS